jgi:hypothetical protein
MATDMFQERRWKLAVAKQLAAESSTPGPAAAEEEEAAAAAARGPAGRGRTRAVKRTAARPAELGADLAAAAALSSGRPQLSLAALPSSLQGSGQGRAGGAGGGRRSPASAFSATGRPGRSPERQAAPSAAAAQRSPLAQRGAASVLRPVSLLGSSSSSIGKGALAPLRPGPAATQPAAQRPSPRAAAGRAAGAGPLSSAARQAGLPGSGLGSAFRPGAGGSSASSGRSSSPGSAEGSALGSASAQRSGQPSPVVLTVAPEGDSGSGGGAVVGAQEAPRE